MAAEDDQSESTPLPSKSSPGEEAASSARESSETSLKLSVYWDVLLKTQEIEKDIAARVADTPFQSSNPKVWGVLTALSNRARKRKQGLNMVLKENVHFIGGLVEDYQFRIDSPFVSRDHCKIYRQTFASEDDALKSQPLVFLKDMSSNGTYVNRIRYTRRDKAVQIHHGDMISFALPLSHDISFSFMYREVLQSDVSSNGVLGKRKAPAEEDGCEVGISVDDFRSLQLSNVELRKKLEDRGVTMLQNENIASMLHHHHHQTVTQKRGWSETTTEIMEDSSRWGEAEAEAGIWLVGISNDDDDGREKCSDEELCKPPPSEEEESMGSCPPEEDEEEYNNFCNSKSTFKMKYRDSDSEESGEEVVSELRERTHHIFKHITDDKRKFGFDSDGLLIIEEESATKELLLVKQDKDEEEEEEESMGSSPNSSLPRISSSVITSSSSSQTTTYFAVTAAAAALNLNSNKKRKRKKKSIMSSVTSSHSLHSYFGLPPTEEDSKKKKKKMTISSVMTPPSEHCCYYGLSMNSRNKKQKKKKKKSISSVMTFQSVCSSSSHDSYVESGEEVVSPDHLRRIISGKRKQAVG